MVICIFGLRERKISYLYFRGIVFIFIIDIFGFIMVVIIVFFFLGSSFLGFGSSYYVGEEKREGCKVGWVWFGINGNVIGGECFINVVFFLCLCCIVMFWVNRMW